jgi:hypothetical protein
MRKSLLLPVMFVAAGCQGDDTGILARDPDPQNAFAASSAALQKLGPGWGTDVVRPHGCFASVASRGGRIPYLYRSFALRLPAGVQSRDGAVASFRYRAVRSNGATIAVLNCVIPATDRAREMLARWLKLPTGPEVGGVVLMDGDGCVLENSPANPCPIEPIVVTPPPADNPCDVLDPCIPGPMNGGGGGATWEPPATGGGVPCTQCGPGTPILTCGNGSPVTRGVDVRCSVSNSGDQRIAGWAFTDGTNSVTAPGGSAEWSGTAVASGIVSADLVEGTTLQAQMTVNGRGWTWATHAVSEYRDGTGAPCFSHTPTYNRPNAENLQIGATECGKGGRFIQPDSYAPAGDGFTAATVPSGPNQGMHYVVQAKLYLRRESTYSSGLWPNARQEMLHNNPPWTQARDCGPLANWYQFSTCMGAGPDAFIAGVRNHEGWGSTGHNGHFSAAYDAVADPANDPMRYFEETVGSNQMSLGDFIITLREGFYARAREADRATLDGGPVMVGNWSGIYWGWLGDHFSPMYNLTF